MHLIDGLLMEFKKHSCAEALLACAHQQIFEQISALLARARNPATSRISRFRGAFLAARI
jgi:hypothetical protein